MSNSVYSASNEAGAATVNATPVQPGNFQASAALAGANPVDIYVERVLAKVKVTNTNGTEGITSSEATNKPLFNDGSTLEEKAIFPVVTGYHLAATSKTSYLLKSLNFTTTWSKASWNDITNKRSYWAKSATTEYDYNPYTTSHTTQTMYCQENTSATKTTLVALAQLKLGSATGSNMESFVKHGGFYYMKTDYLANAASFLTTNKFTHTSGNSDWNNYIEVKKSEKSGAKPWEVTIQLTEGGENLTNIQQDETESTADAINTLLNENFGGAWMWTDGKAYFYVPIEHFGTEDAATGVVRNHAYELTIEAVKGLGTPVFDPDEDIVPEKPTDSESSISARINVLKWRVVKQSVTLE